MLVFSLSIFGVDWDFGLNITVLLRARPKSKFFSNHMHAKQKIEPKFVEVYRSWISLMCCGFFCKSITTQRFLLLLLLFFFYYLLVYLRPVLLLFFYCKTIFLTDKTANHSSRNSIEYPKSHSFHCLIRNKFTNLNMILLFYFIVIIRGLFMHSNWYVYVCVVFEHSVEEVLLVVIFRWAHF